MEAEEVVPGVAIAAARYSGVVIRSGSTEWMRNGSKMVVNMTVVIAARAAPDIGVSAEQERSSPGRAFRRRDGPHRRNLHRRLGRGVTAAPGRESLALLPSGPDAVRTLPVRGTLPVNTTCADPIPTKPSLGRRSVPLERISGSGNR